MNIEKFFFMSVTTVVSLKKVVGSTVTRKLGRVCSSALYCINFWLSFWMEVTHCGFWEWFFGLTRWPNLLVGCTIDCHSEISSSLVRGHVPGSNLHGTVPPLVIASNLCKVDPHDACFNSSRFPFFFSLYDLWVPPFHCCFYLFTFLAIPVSLSCSFPSY